MGCIVKIKEGVYLEWYKVCDGPISDLLTKEEVEAFLTGCAKHDLLIAGKEVTEEAIAAFKTKIWNRIETTGTSDSSGVVDLNFILEYNHLGPNGEAGTFEDILNHCQPKKI